MERPIRRERRRLGGPRPGVRPESIRKDCPRLLAKKRDVPKPVQNQPARDICDEFGHEAFNLPLLEAVDVTHEGSGFGLHSCSLCIRQHAFVRRPGSRLRRTSCRGGVAEGVGSLVRPAHDIQPLRAERIAAVDHDDPQIVCRRHDALQRPLLLRAEADASRPLQKIQQL